MKTKPYWYVYPRKCGDCTWLIDAVFETRESADECAAKMIALGYSAAIVCIRLPIDADTTPQIYDAGGAVDLEK